MESFKPRSVETRKRELAFPRFKRSLCLTDDRLTFIELLDNGEPSRENASVKLILRRTSRSSMKCPLCPHENQLLGWMGRGLLLSLLFRGLSFP